MNHLTNLYKHKCEQLEEQIYNMKKILTEAQGTRDPTVIRKPKSNDYMDRFNKYPSTPVTPQQPLPDYINNPALIPIPTGIPQSTYPYPTPPQPNNKPMPKPMVHSPVDSAIDYLQQGLQTFGPEYTR
tara:strand:- start:550 stop:933 length:384 start_codon:yes stop_codon:yes gene_type:complete